MWLCSKEGFFSIVQKEDSDRLDVRARVRADLIALSTQYLGIADPEIYEFPHTDYQYRIFLTHEEWAQVLMNMARNINYPNFKRKVKQIQGHRRSHFYGDVWRIMARMGRACDT